MKKLTEKQKLKKAIEMLEYLAQLNWLPDSTADSIYDLLEQLEK